MARKVSPGVIKLISISAVTLGISIGLCGVTFLAAKTARAGEALIPFGIFELLGMALGTLGIIIGAISALIEIFFTGEPTQPTDITDKDPQ